MRSFTPGSTFDMLVRTLSAWTNRCYCKNWDRWERLNVDSGTSSHKLQSYELYLIGPGCFDSITSIQAEPFQYQLFRVTGYRAVHTSSRFGFLLPLWRSYFVDLYTECLNHKGDPQLVGYIDVRSWNRTNHLRASFMSRTRASSSVDSEYFKTWGLHTMMMCVAFHSSWELEIPTELQSAQLCIVDSGSRRGTGILLRWCHRPSQSSQCGRWHQCSDVGPILERNLGVVMSRKSDFLEVI